MTSRVMSSRFARTKIHKERIILPEVLQAYNGIILFAQIGVLKSMLCFSRRIKQCLHHGFEHLERYVLHQYHPK